MVWVVTRLFFFFSATFDGEKRQVKQGGGSTKDGQRNLLVGWGHGHLEFGFLGSDFHFIAFHLHSVEAIAWPIISYQPLDMMLFSNLYSKFNWYTTRGYQEWSDPI